MAKINRFRPTFIGATDRKKVGRNSVLPLFFCFVLFFFRASRKEQSIFGKTAAGFWKDHGNKRTRRRLSYVILILILSANAKGAKKMSDETRRLASSLSSSSSSSSSYDDENNNNKKEEKRDSKGCVTYDVLRKRDERIIIMMTQRTKTTKKDRR